MLMRTVFKIGATLLLFDLPGLLVAHGGLDHHDHHSHDDHHNDKNNNHHHHHHHGSFCGAKDPSVEESLEEVTRIKAFRKESSRRRLYPVSCQQLCDQCVEITVNMHILMVPIQFGSFIPHPTKSYQRWNQGKSVSATEFSTASDVEKIFSENLDLLNDIYKGTPFKFNLKDVTRTANLDWATNSANHYWEMSAALGSTDPAVMDVYLSLQLTDDGNDYLGMATNAASQAWHDGDGVFIRYDVLSGGGMEGNDNGYILAHEVGHWLGLWHTFQEPFPGFGEDDDKCDPALLGDFVDDTPLHNGPSAANYDCMKYLDAPDEELPDSCPNTEGTDPIFNFMNYVADEQCWVERGEFTCQQKERMWLAYKLHREQVTACEEGEMEIEIAITLQETFEETTFVLSDEDGIVYYDSVRDHMQGAKEVFARTMLSDLCVPEPKSYTLKVMDSVGNGFDENSVLSFFLNRRLIQRVQGDFGLSVTMTFSSDGSVTTSYETRPEPAPVPGGQRTRKPTPGAKPSPGKNQNSTEDDLTEESIASRSPTPTGEPTAAPSLRPSLVPSEEPTPLPSMSMSPTETPTESPTDHPTSSSIPTQLPSMPPSMLPSFMPSEIPSDEPTAKPSSLPTVAPSGEPSAAPTLSMIPSASPNAPPVTDVPTASIQEETLKGSVELENSGPESSSPLLSAVFSFTLPLLIVMLY